MNIGNIEKDNVFADSSEIEAAVERLAVRIRQDYKNKKILLIGVLKGSFIFLADLARKMEIDTEIDFIGLSSYGKNRISSGSVRLYYEPKIEVAGRDVVLVEDIVDTGLSTAFAINYLNNRKAKSIKLCALLDKKCRREVEVNIDYTGFIAPDRFLVGYGLDYNESYRNLRNIIILGEE